jgi:hypothetical protein
MPAAAANIFKQYVTLRPVVIATAIELVSSV